MHYFLKIYSKIIKCFSLFFIASILVYIPLKITSYGWSPNIGMVISSVITENSEIPPNRQIIAESIKSLTPIYQKAVEDNLISIVTCSFILFNIVGLCFASNHIAWFAAMALLMVFDKDFIIRLLSCSPIILICLLFISLSIIFSSSIKEHKKTTFLFFIYFICLLRCTILADVFTFDIIDEKYDYLWHLPFNESYKILFQNTWLLFFPIIICLAAHKQKTRVLEQFNNPFLATALCIQLAMNLGFIDLAILRDTFLLMWLTETFSKTIKTIECFKEMRVKHCLGLFILLAFTILATHDNLGRFSKTAIHQVPVDFSMKELKDWAPEPGCILYNDDSDFAFSQYYAYPKAKYEYKYMDTNRLFLSEINNISNIKNMLKQGKTPLPDYYQNWVNQMEPGDRLITSAKINGLNNIAWIQLNQKYWLGKPILNTPQEQTDQK